MLCEILLFSNKEKKSINTKQQLCV